MEFKEFMLHMNEFSIKDLEYALEKYDKVFLLSFPEEEEKVYLDELCAIADILNITDKILILTVYSEMDDAKAFTVKRVYRECSEEIKKMYLSYEFSNGFYLLSKETLFGGLQNYVDTGILQKIDAAELLFKY